MPDLPVNEYIDTAEGLARIRGNEKIYARMLGLFQQSEEFGKFEEAIASGDMNAAADVAHAIKGMTGNLSLKRVFELSADLMNQLRGGSYDETTLADYRAALVETQKAVAETLALIGG